MSDPGIAFPLASFLAIAEAAKSAIDDAVSNPVFSRIPHGFNISRKR
jgi:hypothetical protein